MVVLLRHSLKVREGDGGIHRDISMRNFHDFCEQIANLTFDDWKDCRMNGKDKICLGYNNCIEYMRSVQGHTGGVHRRTTCPTHGLITYIILDERWTRGLQPKEDSSHEELELNKDDRRETQRRCMRTQFTGIASHANFVLEGR